MSRKQPFYWPVHRLKEGLRLYSYTKKQTIEITYHLSIESKTSKQITLAIPLPPTTKEQTITDLKVHLPNVHRKTDNSFGNHYFITSIEPLTTKLDIPVFTCNATIHPYHSDKSVSPPLLLSPTERAKKHIHPTDPRIQTLAKNIGRGSSFKKTAGKIHAHIVKTLAYGDPIDGLYSDLDALLRLHTDCGGYAALFVSLCLANAIPARIVGGFFLDGVKNGMHAWAEFQNEKGHWIPVDPSTEQLAKQGRTHKSGRFGFVGSDRLQLSQGCDIPIEDNNKIYSAPILQHPFIIDGREHVLIRAKIVTTRERNSSSPSYQGRV